MPTVTDLLKTTGLRPLGSTTCGTPLRRCCSLKAYHLAW